jgi:hypothetical protein
LPLAESGIVEVRPLTKAFGWVGTPTFVRLLGPVGGAVPNLEDVDGIELDVVADDELEFEAPRVVNNARGALGGALPDIQSNLK